MRRRYVIKGRVQGVGYRQFAAEAARKLNLAGWVKNLANRDVEAEAQGQSELIAEYEIQLRIGSPLAQVDELQISDLPELPHASALFEIRR
jgi:acylphosphatase